MKYCPRCHCEYEDHARICSDCDVDLVANLDHTKGRDHYEELIGEDQLDTESRIVEVYEANTEEEALTVKSLLNYNGIKIMMKRLDVGSYMNITYGFNQSGIKLYVLETDLEVALELLKEFTYVIDDEEELKALQAGDDHELVAESIAYRKKRRRIMQTYLLFSGVSLVVIVAIVVFTNLL